MSKHQIDEISVVRELVRDACWTILYHENRLHQAHRKLAATRMIFERGSWPEIDVASVTADHYDEDIADNPNNAVVLMRMLLADPLHSIEHHERTLREAHDKLSAVKAVVARGAYQIDAAEIMREEAKKFDEPEE